MALASLTVDLTLALARFEADSGKAAQIVARDQEKMSAAARAFERQLERLADQAGRTSGQFLALKAAELGVGGDGTKIARLIEQIERQGSATAAASNAQIKGISATTSAAEASAERQRTLNQQLVESIRAVNRAYEQRRAELIAQEKIGTITPETLKTGLAGLGTQRGEAIRQLKEEAELERRAQLQADALAKAEREAAEAAEAAAAKQRAAAQSIVDAQNGLNASYRQRLALLRELRDAGNLTPQQFRAAGTDLVNQQPAVQRRRQEAAAAQAAADAQKRAQDEVAAAAVAAAERQRAAGQAVIDQQRGLTASYRARLAALRELRDAEIISPAQFRAAGTELVNAQPALQKRRQAAEAAQQQADAQARADKVAADAAEESARRQAAAAQAVIDQQRGLSASYRQRLQALRELRDAELITPAQFRQAGTELVNSQPVIQRRRAEIEAAERAADAQRKADEEAALSAEESARRQAAAARAIIDQQNGLTASYRQRLAALRELRDAGQLTPTQFRQAGTELVNQQPVVAQRRAAAEAAKKEADEIVAAAAKKAAAEQAAADKFVAALKLQADAIGKTRAEILLQEAAQRGVADQVRPYIDRIAAADASLNKFGRTSNVARYQLLQLQYTVSDTVASLASGISPLTILLQQGGQVVDAFSSNGGIGAAFKTISSVITPFRIAAAGAAGVLGALAFSAYQGAEQSKQLADALVLSGNAAGQSAGPFTALTRQIAASGEIGVKNAREFGLALIQTGEVGARNFDLAAEAASRFGAATGKNAKEVAGIFAGLNRDVAGAAATLNQQYNFLSAAQLQQIRQLQEQGRSTEALSIVYEALNTRLKALEPNLGTLDRILRTAGNEWQRFWDRAFDVGRTESIEDKIDRARAAAEAARRVGSERESQSIGTDPQRRAQQAEQRSSGTSQADRADETVRLLNRAKAAQDATAAAAAELVKLNKDAAGADEFVRGFDRRAKSAEGLKRALDEANAAFAKQDRLAAADSNYKPSTAEQRAAILKQIREDFTDKPTQTEANQVEKAQRDKALKEIEGDLAKQRAAYAFHNDYLKRIYDDGAISLETFFAERRAAADADEKAQIDGLNKQIAIQERYRDAIQARDPSEAVQAEKAIAALQDEVAAATVQRQRRVVLANQEEAASYRTLRERVVEYKAGLLELEGDSAGAARERAKNAIETARLLARQSGGTVTEDDVRRQERALDIANQFADAQRRLSFSTADASRAEEIFLLLAEKSGLTLRAKEQGVLAIRQEALGQLQKLTEEAQRLTETTSDPRVRAFAADLAVQFAKAAENVDPLINRLRAGVDDLAGALANTFSQSFANAESLEDLVKGLAKNFQNFAIRVSLQEPIEDFFRTSLRGLLPGAAGGAGTASATAAQSAAISTNTGAVTASTGALAALTQAAGAAAAALAAISGQKAASGFSSYLGYSSPGGSGLEGLSPDALSYFYHSGGVVGAGGRAALVPASVFAGARRYHSGGIGGLMPDEVPAVLRKGEEVVRRDDPRHRFNGGGRAAMNVQIYNNNGSEVRAEPGDDGSMKIFIDAAKAAVADDIARGGRVYSATKQRFGLQPALPRSGR